MKTRRLTIRPTVVPAAHSTDNLKQEEKAIVRVEEMQAVMRLNGKYTMQGEQLDTVEVDLVARRNNIIQATEKMVRAGQGNLTRLMIWICTATASGSITNIKP